MINKEAAERMLADEDLLLNVNGLIKKNQANTAADQKDVILMIESQLKSLKDQQRATTQQLEDIKEEVDQKFYQNTELASKRPTHKEMNLTQQPLQPLRTLGTEDRDFDKLEEQNLASVENDGVKRVETPLSKANTIAKDLGPDRLATGGTEAQRDDAKVSKDG